jgi:hypothetical protein
MEISSANPQAADIVAKAFEDKSEDVRTAAVMECKQKQV